MSSELVLITGATGHLGFRVLRYALEYGHHVRAAVRSESKAELLRAHHLIKPFANQLSFVIVSDILAVGAYDKAIKDVKYIIHVASPLSTTAAHADYQTAIVQPALRGTLNILEAAQKQGDQIKRIVITSSIVAVTPLGAMVPPAPGSPAPGSPAPRRVSASDRLETPTGPFTAGWPTYHASKFGALNAAEDFVKKNNVSFDVVHLHPSFIEGRNDLTTTLSGFKVGTNRNIVNLALGEKDENGNFIVTNHVDDTAVIHIKALETAKVPAKSYIVSNPGDDGIEWNDIKTILRSRYSEAVKEGIFSLEGDVPSFKPLYAVGDTEQVFGLKFKSFEEQVTSVLDHYLEVYAKEKGGK